MRTRTCSFRRLNIRSETGAINSTAPRFSSGFVAETAGAPVSDEDVIAARFESYRGGSRA